MQCVVLLHKVFKEINRFELARNEYVGEQNKVSGKISKLPSIEKMFRSIERQQQIKENLYLLLLQKEKKQQLLNLLQLLKQELLMLHMLPQSLFHLKETWFLLIALVLGLLFLLFYLFKQLFNNKIVTKHDLRKTIHAPIIAELPSLEKGDSDIVKVNDITPMAEAFRILITNMNFMLSKRKMEKLYLLLQR
jgi:hypothetical protein